MTLEGEYYSEQLVEACDDTESQSSWHWKANITNTHTKIVGAKQVAIHMTFEGEYYKQTHAV